MTLGKQLASRGAVIDTSGKYRYSLNRKFKSGEGHITFVMLNPNQADAEHDDPTICKCMSYALRWGFQSLEVVNLFAFRTPSPQDLKKAHDPVGGENDEYLREAFKRSDLLMLAWGNHGGYLSRDRAVLELRKRSHQAWCLMLNRDGQPRHPLYVPLTVTPQPYSD